MPKKNANLGKSWEHEIQEVHDRYDADGRASCVRNPAPMRPIARLRGGEWRAIFEAKGAPDYSVQAGDVSFVFDAKDAAGSRWPLDGLALHQAERFSKHERQGRNALAFVLLRLAGQVWLLPWTTSHAGLPLCARWHRWHDGEAERGEASLDATACAEIGVPLPSADWLEAALALVRSPLASAPSSLPLISGGTRSGETTSGAGASGVR